MLRPSAGSPQRLLAALLVLSSAPMPAAMAAAPAAPAARPVPVSPAPVTPTPAMQVPVSQDDAYLLGPGDGLELKFFAAKELSGPAEILSDGTASLPLLGLVRLNGLTIAQATSWLETLYRRQLLRPDLQLILSRPRPLRVALVGEVERPGLYTLTLSEVSQTEAKVSISGLPTLVDAIQKAGGITALANLRAVLLQRRLPGEPVRYKRTRVDLLALVQEGDQLQNPVLFDGDTIRLERATESAPETIALAATTLAPEAITVNVVGEVKSPGRLEVPASTPLVQAVLAAGGPISWRANQGKVELVRINRNGSATRRSYGLNLSQGASNAANPPLRDGDTVYVRRSGLAVVSDALTAVGQPLTSLASILALIQVANTNNN